MHLNTLQDYVSQSSNIVFFGGAGVSTESGIPDFRSVDGLYNQKWKYPPEVMISHSFFANQTSDFFEFYRSKLLHLDAQPNNAHLALAALEKAGKLKAVITQNIDGLHQKAGSKNVIELHGSVWRNYCLDCGKAHGVEVVASAADVPFCLCGGIIKPDVVLYEESLEDDLMIAAMDYIAHADMLIIGGTSLGVYPAAGLLQVYKGKRLVLINKTATHMDEAADLVIRDNIGDALSCFV
ncbi:MAG: NAD-dependent protein deacylase [Defluviitaleaceae bacterium]|nr:NAD-dependent protein deacylase [Defluviitaleaceae bacterium]